MAGGEESFSADVDDLDAFAEISRAEAQTLSDRWSTLRGERDLLAGSPLPTFVESTALDRYRDLVELIGENGRFVAEISGALRDFGDHIGSARYRVSTEVVAAELARTSEERLDRLEGELVAGGVDPAEARKVRDEVAAQLAGDPALGFGEAVARGLAAHRGITLDEAERSLRAFGLTPPEVSSTLEEHFDEVAGRAGRSDQITLEDLHAVIGDPDAASDLRDAAHRLAADPILYNNLDTALQTDLSSEPLTNGFAWNRADGIIGRGDVEVFAERDHQARVLLAWHPLVDTASQGYELGRADAHVSADDVKAFVGDGDIPLYVRLAVFDIYAERLGLDLDQRVELEEELAFDATGFVGGATVLEASGGPVQGRAPVLVPPPGGATVGRARTGPTSGGGAGAAVLAQLLVVGAEFGWRRGRLARVERAGEPRFVATDPVSGRETVVDPAQLAELTPDQAKAWVAHFAATGQAPGERSATLVPHAYLDPFGQWRMSDTNEPVWSPPPDGQFFDPENNLRYTRNGELVQPEPEPQLATDGAGARSRDGSGGSRRSNVERSESPIWQSLQVAGDGVRTNGLKGRKQRFFEWDKTHNDIEVYDQNRLHLGSMDPVTGEIYKPPVPGRRLGR